MLNNGKPLKFKKCKRYTFQMHRELIPLIGNETGKSKSKDVYNPHTEKTISVSENSEVFDSEFYYRDGPIFRSTKHLQAGMKGYISPSENVFGPGKDVPSIRCHYSNINLVF